MRETQSTYFEPENSVSMSGSNEIFHVLSVISRRYMAQNPPHSFRFRGFHTDSFLSTGVRNGRFDINLGQKLPDAQDGSFSLVATRFKKERDDARLLVRCYGPVVIYLNGKDIWHSSVREDVNVNVEASVELPCVPGWNLLVIRCQKAASGFGCILGPYEPRWRWMRFLTPFKNRRGQGGFIYSQAMENFVIDITSLQLDSTEAETGLIWFPKREWSPADSSKGCFGRLFGQNPGAFACGWSAFEQTLPGVHKVRLEFSEGRWYLDGEKIIRSSSEVLLSSGTHEIFAVVPCPEQGPWDLSFKAVYPDGKVLPQKPPRQVFGVKEDWLYLGPFTREPDVKSCQTLYGLLGDDEKIFWKPDEPNTTLRPYVDTSFFGRWNYPLGVTLYGLIQAGRVLKRQDIIDYVGLHMDEIVHTHDYSLWDAETYGYPEINNQLVGLEMLDDCGSFGSAMLEYYCNIPNNQVHSIANRIADYIRNKQERRENGAFFRIRKGHWMENTMWVDDLYMSIPFLCRYARLSGDQSFIDDAVLQVRGFKEYLFMPEYKVMSHVYDFKYNTATKMPWGRGNGWCLFSLSELLEAMPRNHKDRQEVLSFFTTLCEGYLALQGRRGLWHQFLLHSDSYEETSCTAMFVYAFCRAVRFGWVNGELADSLFTAAKRGWQGLCEIAIDESGNIYGVCMGSSYSFTPDYYQNVLGWILNDPHGTGIVLLAGIEIAKLIKTNPMVHET
jgi:rhamnogalacturonyl hydrolase YesR